MNCTTRVVVVNPSKFEDEELREAAELLRAGKLVAFPTETVYGLGANALDSDAVSGIFLAKGRPQDNPLIVHISEYEMLERLTDRVPDSAAALARRFWPGPLTLVLRRRPGAVPDNVTAGLPSVAVRLPAHPIARRMIALAGVPVAAPSANVSGRPSPTLAKHVLDDLRGRVPLVVDGGACTFGVESTVVDVECPAAGGRPIVLRPGGVTLEQLREVVPEMSVYSRLVHGDAAAEKPATPGLKYRHYAPRAPVVLFDPHGRGTSPSSGLAAAFAARVTPGTGVIRTHAGPDRWPYDTPGGVVVREIGDERTDPAAVERNLFDALRSLDDSGVTAIIVEGVGENGEGLAIMNRLRKAAAETVDASSL